MGDEKKGDDLVVVNQKQFEFEATYKDLQIWVSKHSLPVKAAVTAVVRDVATIAESTYDGGTLGLFVEYFYTDVCSTLKIKPSSLKFISQSGRYKPLVQSFLGGKFLEPARNFAIMNGVNAVITCVMKELRGKEDVQTNLVAGFGYGVVLSLVTGMRGHSVMSVGVICALMNVGISKTKIFEKRAK